MNADGGRQEQVGGPVASAVYGLNGKRPMP